MHMTCSGPVQRLRTLTGYSVFGDILHDLWLGVLNMNQDQGEKELCSCINLSPLPGGVDRQGCTVIKSLRSKSTGPDSGNIGNCAQLGCRSSDGCLGSGVHVSTPQAPQDGRTPCSRVPASA